ncbi:hypothetical protein SAMN05444354_10519 [Stigmatella aurantiaca]|uniref:Lipoprotein n=1 Tax=Stigmatella aurantiaca TaxID=41 RepID=A0A1H7NPQ4_STIAU|nr:hypothetical protein [Stigmatella aurantiaca]SEL25005.1 hypothetical protein SAMN05444354_10519 [Stigmatella aurantiaca]
MNGKGIRKWGLLGALAAAAALAPACNENGRIKEGTDNEGVANTSQPLDTFQDKSATGGSGAADETAPAAPHEATGAQGNQSGIGAPGFSSPREGTEGSDLYRDEPVKGESLHERKPSREIEGPGADN